MQQGQGNHLARENGRGLGDGEALLWSKIPPPGRASHTLISKIPCSVPSDIPWSQHEFPWGKEQPESEDEVQDKTADGRR